jgi:hypothetical protein
MSKVKYQVFLDQFFTKKEADIWSEHSSIFHLKPLINEDELLERLNNIPGVLVYKKNQIPNYLYYKNNNRIGDIIIVAKEGVVLIYSKNLNKKKIEFFNKKSEKSK